MKFTKLISFLFLTASLLFLGACSNASGPSDDPGSDDPVPSAVPAAPENLTIVSGDASATLVWTAVTGATSYNVYWSNTTGVTPTTGTKQTVSKTTFSHKGLINSEVYYYVVTAVNAAGESAPSEQKLATPQDPTTPNNVSVSAGNNVLIIGWLPIAEANSYNIYWSNSPGVTQYNSTKIENSGAPYSHQNLVNGRKYYYRITSVINGVESPPSFEVSGTPMNPFLDSPEGITATAGVNSASVTWGTVLNADSFTVYYSTTQNDLSSANKITGATSPTVIPNLNGGETYYVSVVTVQGEQESTPAETTSVVPNGFCFESSASGLILKGYRGSLEDLIIPSSFQGTPVTSIAENAFKDSDVSGILSIPSTITSIGQSAFYNCGNLTGDLLIPSSVTTIGASAFYGCSSLTGSISLPAGLTAVANSTFYGCSKITAVYFGDSMVSSIGYQAFYNCSSLAKVAKTSEDSGTDIYLPEALTEYAYAVFGGCKKLAGTLTIPANIKSIGNYAFLDCESLTGDLVIPDTVTSIGTGAFNRCSGFNGSLRISDKITEIQDEVFSGCSGLSGTITLPANLTKIGYSAFYRCSNLSGTVTLPSTLENIQTFAFSNCIGLTGNIVLPEGLTYFDMDAFNECSGLTGTITVPASVTSLGSDGNASEIFFNEIKFLGTVPPANLDKVRTSIWTNLAVVSVPTAAVAAYQTTIGAGSTWYSKITPY